MKNAIFIILISCIALSNDLTKIQKYEPSNDVFLYSGAENDSLKSDYFIMNLKEVLDKDDLFHKKIKSVIRKYEKRKDLIEDLKLKFNSGLDHENGKKINEDVFLIKNPNNFYFVGGLLSSLIIAPLLTDISDITDWLNGEDEENNDPFYDADEEEERRNNRDENVKSFGKFTFLPGISIIAIGYFGSKYKIGQKERIITKDELIMPNLLEFFKENELDMAIKIYNSKIKI
tara:strand:+ start:154 stop:846 length:693 start_codon:yes stop_codon:yes gene_type:complete